MTMEFNPTRLYWTPRDGEPIELSGHVKTVTMYRVDPEEPFPSTFGMKPITLRLKGRATPQLYRLLLGRTHPRIRRMHSAYGRKRGGGRW